MRLAIIGAGSIGQRHARNLVGLGFSDIWIADTSPGAAVAITQSLGVGTAVSCDDDALLDCDAALICTPPSSHVPYAIRFALAGLHLFIEKPLCAHGRELDRLVRMIHERKLVSMVGCNYRFEPGMRMLKDALQSKAIGRPILATASFGQDLRRWRRTPYHSTYSAHRDEGGGVWLDRIHELDYLSWLFGLPTAGAALLRSATELNIDAEEAAVAAIGFPQGVLATIALDYLSPTYHCACTVVGTGGRLTWRFRPSSVTLTTSEAESVLLFEDTCNDDNAMYVEQLRHFVDAVRNGRDTIQNVAEASALLEFALSLRDSGSA